MSETSPIKRAVQLMGGPVSAAKKLGVKRYQTVQQWVRKGSVPAEFCPQIEMFTDGRVTCEVLRPAVDWGYLRRSPAGAETQQEVA
jgi:DNA-binding transcriptional regulator YdaS (Cro superfamily)